MLLDVACNMPETSAKEVVEQAFGHEVRGPWNEHHKLQVCSEGERCAVAAGRAHMTCAGCQSQYRRLKPEPTHLVYPYHHSLSRRYRCRHLMPRGRPPDPENRCVKVCVGADAEEACRRRNSGADASDAVTGCAEGLRWPIFTFPEPIGCPVRACEPCKDDDAATGV